MPETIITFDDTQAVLAMLLSKRRIRMSICFADVFVGIVSLLTIGAVGVFTLCVITESIRFRKQARAFEQWHKMHKAKGKHIH